MSEISKLIAEIKSEGILRGGNKLEQLYSLAEQKEKDYATLQQKLDAMAAENAALKYLQPTQQMITAAHRELEEYDNIQIDDDAVVFTWQAMRGQQKTPATDAYLNSLRAEGVEMVKEHPAISLCSLNHVCEEIAVKLRSGTHDTADKAGAK